MLVGLNPVAMPEVFNWICYDPLICILLNIIGDASVRHS